MPHALSHSALHWESTLNVMCFISLQKRTLPCNKSSSIQTRNQNMPEHCASRLQYIAGRCCLHLVTKKDHRPFPRHLLSPVLIFYYSSSLFLRPALRFSTSFLVQRLCHPLSLSLQSTPQASFFQTPLRAPSKTATEPASLVFFLSLFLFLLS